MRCAACGHDNPEGNRFCGQCGAALGTGAHRPDRERRDPTAPVSDEEQLRQLDEFERQAGARAASSPPPHDAEDRQEAPIDSLAPTDTTDTTDARGERDVWRGRYSNRTLAGGLIFAFTLAVVLSLVAMFLTSNYWGNTMDTIVWILVGVIVLAVVGRSLVRWARHRFTLRYRLSTERLFIERGFFSRTRDEIELIRVDDVRVRQSLMDRIFKVGRVFVISTDRSDADLVMLGIDDPDAVKEKIRQYTRARRKKSLHVENL